MIFFSWKQSPEIYCHFNHSLLRNQNTHIDMPLEENQTCNKNKTSTEVQGCHLCEIDSEVTSNKNCEFMIYSVNIVG